MANMGTLAVKLEAKVAEFKRRMAEAGKSVKGFSKDGERDLSKFDKAIGKIEKSMTRAAGIIGTGLTAVAGGVLAATNQLANQGREIENFSRLANTSTRDFQALSIGARQFGFESDKVADILKDMNDRVGDFVQTGGGPMADFFENIGPKVGVTAEHFKNLSGADALQLYVSSLEKANLSQADMTFYMEAIASDSTVLLPLLQDNGKALKEIGDEAERTGQILSEMDLQKLQELDKSLRQIKGQLEGVKNEVLIEAVPAFQELANEINKPETIQNMQTLAKAAAELAKWTVQAAGAFTDFGGKLGQEIGVIAQGIGGLDLEEQRGRILNALENPSERLRFFGPGGIVEYFDEAELKAELDRINGLIELQKQTQAAVALEGPAAAVAEADAKLTDKQVSLITTMTAKIEELEQQILSGENAVPLQERIDALKKQIEETKNATKDGKKPVEDNSKATNENTNALKALAEKMTKDTPAKPEDKRISTTEGGKTSEAWDMLIRRTRTIAGSTQASASDKAVFENAANAMIARFEGMGGFDTDKMRSQMQEMLSRMGDATKEGMKEAAQELTGGDAKKSIGTITIKVQSDKGETSGEVTGDTSFLSKLASTLQSVSTAV